MTMKFSNFFYMKVLVKVDRIFKLLCCSV